MKEKKRFTRSRDARWYLGKLHDEMHDPEYPQEVTDEMDDFLDAEYAKGRAAGVDAAKIDIYLANAAWERMNPVATMDDGLYDDVFAAQEIYRKLGT